MSDCRHHWMLGPQVDRVTQGQCKHCGAEREWRAADIDFNAGIVLKTQDRIVERIESVLSLADAARLRR